MKVLIIESSSPDDFYDDQLDGHATSRLLRLLDVQFEMHVVIDENRLKRSLKRASEGSFDVVHLSCHGDSNGIRLANRTDLDWAPLATLFQRYRVHPRALVMSACCGASSGIGDAFAGKSLRPNIIFGSTDERSYDDYAVAWAILYRVFENNGVTRDSAQTALAHINAVVSDKFKYRRWDDREEEYLVFPGRKARYGVVDVAQLEDEEIEFKVY